MQDPATRKRIVYLNYMEDLYGSALGSTIKAKELLHGLKNLGYSVHIFWRCAKTANAERSKPDRMVKIKQFFRTILYTPAQIFKALRDTIKEAKLLHTIRPDLVIIRLDPFRFSGLLVAKYFKRPLIIEADGACSYEWLNYHNGPHLWASWLLFVEKCILKYSQKIFVQSGPAKTYYIQTHCISPKKITVITNGAHPRTPIPEENLNRLRKQYGIHSNTIVIGFSGSMHLWHGIEQIKTLIINILSQHDEVKFLFVGGGGPVAESIHSQLAHKDRIVFTGNIDFKYMPDHLALFSIAMAPYPPMDLFYFSPVKLFEYMAAGTAIVAASIGQIQTILEHQETAMLYTPGDLDEMQSCLETLIRNPGLRSKLAQNAHHVFHQHYTWTHKAKELSNLIETIKDTPNDQSASAG